MPRETSTFYEQLGALERAREAFVLVILVESAGSVPQDAGAKMLVTNQGRVAGTIGGGRLEAQAIATAQEKLAARGADAGRPQFASWSLRGDAGMTCGGAVKLYFEPHPAGDAGWAIAVFGAGHVAQALLPVIAPLPCAITCCDSRAEWLERLPRGHNVRVVHSENLASAIDSLPEHAFVLCMTQGHKTDRPILARALSSRMFPFVGAIGSPLGLDFGTNHPHEIALSIAAQLVTERDRMSSGQMNRDHPKKGSY
jgi:xanthine dehydrogenase accessory factor